MTSTPEITVEKNVAYTSGVRPLLWDIYRPATSNEATPVVLALHGGGWRGGHREMMEAACIAFARQGYVAIAPEYACWAGEMASSAERPANRGPGRSSKS